MSRLPPQASTLLEENESFAVLPIAAEDHPRITAEQLAQVRQIARRIHEHLPRHVAMDDLVDAGVVGLMDAIQKFDPEKHVQFGSYARFRIRGAILDSLREMDWSPRTLRRKGRELKEVYHELSAALGRNPTEPEVADELGIELHEFQLLLAELKALEVGSLCVKGARGGHEIEDLTEYLPSAPEETPYFYCLRGEIHRLLWRLIAELPEKDRQVLTRYYFEEMTMREIGESMQISEARVSQIRAGAVDRLRSKMQELMKGGQPSNGNGSGRVLGR